MSESPAEPQVPNLLDMPQDALYSARYPMALAYAAVMHADQKRKDDLGTPYITHPVAVSALVWHYGLRVAGFEQEIEELVLAGLLHDVAEDAGGSPRLAEIRDMFGARVAEIVAAATDSLSQDPAQKAPWQERKEGHIERVRQLSAVGSDGTMVDPGSCLVIACDKLHNLTGTAAAVESQGDGYLERFAGGVQGTRWYYRTMFEALKPGLPDSIIHDTAAQLARLGVSPD
ncbi:MAG: HD domain-containing protein [Actinomycetia bacterium]|nr:HD domain-containing protein [Actinomycetes bacterium]